MDIDFSPLLRRCLEAATDELATDFRGVFGRETVARCVEDSAGRIGKRPTVGPNFLPVIIKRYAQERLWAAAQGDGRVDKPLHHHVWDLLETLVPTGYLIALHRPIGGQQ